MGKAAYRLAFTTNQLDSYAPQNSVEGQEVLKTRNDVTFLQDPSLGMHSFWMNTRVKPYDDPRVRRAMSPDEYIHLITRGDGVQLGSVIYGLGSYALPADEVKNLLPYNPQDRHQPVHPL